MSAIETVFIERLRLDLLSRTTRKRRISPLQIAVRPTRDRTLIGASRSIRRSICRKGKPSLAERLADDAGLLWGSEARKLSFS